MAKIIVDVEGNIWSNKFGWVSPEDTDDWDTFSDREADLLDLPIGGKWQDVGWRV